MAQSHKQFRQVHGQIEAVKKVRYGKSRTNARPQYRNEVKLRTVSGGRQKVYLPVKAPLQVGDTLSIIYNKMEGGPDMPLRCICHDRDVTLDLVGSLPPGCGCMMWLIGFPLGFFIFGKLGEYAGMSDASLFFLAVGMGTVCGWLLNHVTVKKIRAKGHGLKKAVDEYCAQNLDTSLSSDMDEGDDV